MKSFYKSKTLWVNALVLTAGVVGYLTNHEILQDQEQLLAGLVAVQGALNIVLRLITSEPIK